ncbi:Mucin-associated surface protein (MASP) [Trypanosoma cruzi]|uniref:Mucin-associated surface protein (MASP), putative n=2 Tax=Trypanosoma cruzi TaxID=5693 RepID=Q4DDU8_TRYCC|nr:mucin-associated surface protein (MASP), putative [Trypanosoma cruzi]EAN90701.1 mucin-associated surface protein (MASP), putative [Trypanosoma cruzi]PWV02231.1 Mucin-associated surface protein (MASP) [Trypanosoma cruzi]|eukprot:XP_812552.1 mucin-associated surface protein (MASP) [Trypanosoma cruzi strain CL Brener]
MAMMMTGRVLLVCALCVLWCGNGFGDARDDRYNEGGRNFLTHTHNGGNDRLRLKADRGLISTRMGLIKAVAAEDDSEGGTTNALLEEKTAAGGISAGSGGDAAPVPKEMEGAAGAGTPFLPSGPGMPGTGAETGQSLMAGQEGNEKNNLDPKKKEATDSKDKTNDELSSPSGSTPSPPGEKLSSTGTDDINQLPKGKVTELGVERQDNRESDEAIEKEDGEKNTEEEEKQKIKAQTESRESKNNAGEKPPSLPAPPPPPPTTPSGGPAPSISEGEGSPPTELKNSQNQKKVTNEATPSESKTDSEATQSSSGVATQGRHSHDTDTEDLMKNAATGSPAETTTTSSTSTSGSGDHVQNREDKDDAQISEEQHDSLETGNTNGVPTLSEAEPQTPATVTAAQKNYTTAPGDSDGSTAASHTTSPLLLLLVFACAAAAAVVAA